MSSRKVSGQLEFSFEAHPPRVIPKKYDENLALEARRVRNRRLGSLILNETNKGFFRVDRGLWIPATKGEISVAVDSPELTINKSKSIIYEKTHHKGYARRAANETRKRIESYYDNAHEQRWKLTRALLINPERSYTEYTVTKSELALEAIIRYVQDLNSFIERDWPQARWKRFAANTDKATKEVRSLYVEELLDLYNEAFWSVRSRMRYWHNRGMNSHEPPEVPNIPFNAVDPTEYEDDE